MMEDLVCTRKGLDSVLCITCLDSISQIYRQHLLLMELLTGCLIKSSWQKALKSWVYLQNGVSTLVALLLYYGKDVADRG
jgi:hypothetical protein